MQKTKQILMKNYEAEVGGKGLPCRNVNNFQLKIRFPSLKYPLPLSSLDIFHSQNTPKSHVAPQNHDSTLLSPFPLFSTHKYTSIWLFRNSKGNSAPTFSQIKTIRTLNTKPLQFNRIHSSEIAVVWFYPYYYSFLIIL